MRRNQIDEGLASLLLGQPDVSERVMRALALKGALPQFLDPRFSGSVNVEDLMAPEYSYLRRMVRMYGGTGVGAGGAGTFGQVTFSTMNAGQRGLAVVEKVFLANIAAGSQQFTIQLMITGANITNPTLAAVGPADDRIGIVPVGFSGGIFGLGFATPAVVPVTTVGSVTVQVPANSSIEVQGPWIVTGAPIGVGRGILVVQAQTANQAIAVAFYWRERALLATELQ